MGQFSVEKLGLPGSVLSGNQQPGTTGPCEGVAISRSWSIATTPKAFFSKDGGLYRHEEPPIGGGGR
jgi:hypothetical protein